MSVTKTLSAVLTAALLAGAAGVALAGPASAVDEGPVLSGGIYWFNQVGPLADQSPATQIKSGSGTNRPWATITTENPCPAGTASMAPYIRIPQAGVPEDDWTQVPIGAAATLKDADGRFYTTTTTGADRLTKTDITAYLTANGGQGTFPFLEACHDSLGNPLGTFRTEITFTGTSSANLAWTIVAPDYAGVQESTTTTVVAGATTIELGDTVTLTATVASAGSTAPTGQVEFRAGATVLGTAPLGSDGTAELQTAALPVGTADVVAVYAGDAGHTTSTSAATQVTVTPVAARTTTTTLAVTPASGNAYQTVTLQASVTASSGQANGTVAFTDGSATLGTATVTGGVVPAFTTNALGAGEHHLVATFTGTAPYSGSASSAVTATYDLQGAAHDQTVLVDFPVGAITISSPYSPTSPLDLGTAVLDPATSTYSASKAFEDITITDTRSGNPGFTASVVATPFTQGSQSFSAALAALTGLTAEQVPGNALLSADVTVQDSVGLDTPKVFATYPAGKALGTTTISGTFGLAGVPSSVQPGQYGATVTLTAI